MLPWAAMRRCLSLPAPKVAPTLTALRCLYRVRTRTIFLDPHRPRHTLDAIATSPSLKRPVALKDGDVSVSVQRLADDMDFPAGVMPKVNELPTQRIMAPALS